MKKRPKPNGAPTEEPHRVMVRLPAELYAAMCRDGRRWLYCAQHSKMDPTEFERRIDQQIALEEDTSKRGADVPLASEIM